MSSDQQLVDKITEIVNQYLPGYDDPLLNEEIVNMLPRRNFYLKFFEDARGNITRESKSVGTIKRLSFKNKLETSTNKPVLAITHNYSGTIEVYN